MRYSVDAMGCDALRRCSAEVQEAVMERGLDGARNASSALLARPPGMTEWNQGVWSKKAKNSDVSCLFFKLKLKVLTGSTVDGLKDLELHQVSRCL